MESRANLTCFCALIALSLIASRLCTAARVGPARSDPTQQAQAAISASLAAARNVSFTVSDMAKSGGLKPREAAAVKDCMVTVRASVDELQRSLRALKSAAAADGGKRVLAEQMKNVQTWVSAALTDETTCMDGFANRGMDGEVKKTIRDQIVEVARLISNALALVSRLCDN